MNEQPIKSALEWYENESEVTNENFEEAKKSGTTTEHFKKTNDTYINRLRGRNADAIEAFRIHLDELDDRIATFTEIKNDLEKKIGTDLLEEWAVLDRLSPRSEEENKRYNELEVSIGIDKVAKWVRASNEVTTHADPAYRPRTEAQLANLELQELYLKKLLVENVERMECNISGRPYDPESVKLDDMEDLPLEFLESLTEYIDKLDKLDKLLEAEVVAKMALDLAENPDEATVKNYMDAAGDVQIFIRTFKSSIDPEFQDHIQDLADSARTHKLQALQSTPQNFSEMVETQSFTRDERAMFIRKALNISEAYNEGEKAENEKVIKQAKDILLEIEKAKKVISRLDPEKKAEQMADLKDVYEEALGEVAKSLDNRVKDLNNLLNKYEHNPKMVQTISKDLKALFGAGEAISKTQKELESLSNQKLNHEIPKQGLH